MNITQVSAGIVRIPPERGGAVKSHIFNLSKQLSKKHNVEIIDKKYPADREEEKFDENLRIIRILSRQLSFFGSRIDPRLNEYLFSKKLKRQLFTDSDIIHAHNLYTGRAITKLAKNSPTVYTSHNGMWCDKNINFYEKRIVRPIEKKIIEKSNVSIALSKNLKKNICEKDRILEEKVEVIPNGVDTRKFYPNVPTEDIKRKYSLKDCKTVLFVGRIAPAKGLEYLVKAGNLLVSNRNMRNVKFVIVGAFKYTFSERKKKSDYVEKLTGLIWKYSLQNNFIFTNIILNNDLLKFYTVCDVFVLPSVFEAFPMFLLEAMASAKLVICSNVCGVPEVVQNGKNIFILRSKNYEGLAERILSLLKDEKLRKRMGKKSREIVEEQFSWEKIGNKIMDVYRNIN